MTPAPGGKGHGLARHALAVALGTAVSFEALLGWDHARTLGADNFEHGPYESWQVIALAVILLLLGVLAGRRGFWDACWAIPPILTLGVVVDQMVFPYGQDDGLREVGEFLLLAGASAVTALVSVVGKTITIARGERASLPVAGWYPDPADRAQWRWWDGATWTDTTS